MCDILLAPITGLLPSEETRAERVREVTLSILRVAHWTTPVCVEAESLVVMDGHHRLAAARVGARPRPGGGLPI